MIWSARKPLKQLCWPWMEVRYGAGFNGDLAKIRNPDLSRRIGRVIEDLKAASTITEARGVRRMTGAERYYRIRIGDYRLGVSVEGNAVTLLRFAHRSEIYRVFP